MLSVDLTENSRCPSSKRMVKTMSVDDPYELLLIPPLDLLLQNGQGYHEWLIKSPDKPKSTTEANEVEAMVSLRKAQELKSHGKKEKALKILERSLVLWPGQPDILTALGEVLEDDDIVQADLLYGQAISAAPHLVQAVLDRNRTFPIVHDLDSNSMENLDQKLALLRDLPSGDPALTQIRREAYFQHIYHTVALEGNTMSLAQTRLFLETKMVIPGKSIAEHNEILGLESALKFIHTELLKPYNHFLTVEDLLQIHRRVLGFENPLQAGLFRTEQVYVGEYTPPPAEAILDLTQSLLNFMNSEMAQRLHPVELAALAHLKLVSIHPFVDGNGRTARLLMNLVLARAGYPPAIIRVQDRGLYTSSIELANKGDSRPFVRLVARSTERTLDVFLYAKDLEYSQLQQEALEGAVGRTALLSLSYPVWEGIPPSTHSHSTFSDLLSNQ